MSQVSQSFVFWAFLLSFFAGNWLIGKMTDDDDDF